MYDKLTVNNEPYISSNGEIICNEYLPENNPVNPESSFGWFIYLILGGGFDIMDEMTKQALNNATTIIKFVLDMKQPINDMTALANLDGLTAKQKVRIETAINLINLSRSELLRATYPNIDIIENPIEDNGNSTENIKAPD